MAERMLSVLVVDDNSDYIQALQLTLEDHFQITGARLPTEAVECLKNNHYDAILSDLHFGSESDMDGIQFTEIARTFHEVTCPIVGVTGDAAEHIHTEWMAAGAQKVLIKPFTVTFLVEALRDVLLLDDIPRH
jgi:CheY-like chemotaxis protein